MQVNIKRIDTSLPLPEYQTSGAVAFDLYSRLDMTIGPKSLGLIPTNLIIETPKGYMLMLASRSSTPKKKGLLVPHGVGIIDQDYCGEKDELLLQVFNFTDQEVAVAKGERMGQGVFVRIEQGQWQEVTEMTGPTRGGFGTTGQH
ncbi:MAG: dUTP diphosphatase [Candidatus Magasanikbacteria bacterium]|nr:dUTP diphosphatase [Candidatus Magasanikbacteria bacterium]